MGDASGASHQCDLAKLVEDGPCGGKHHILVEVHGQDRVPTVAVAETKAVLPGSQPSGGHHA